MPNRSRPARAPGPLLQARLRTKALAQRLGVGLRDARHRAGKLQRDVSAIAGVSQSWVSRMERGQGSGASLESWSAVIAAVDEQLVAYLERASGATLPRDHAHLKGQELVIRTSRPGGWHPMPEAAIDPVAYRSRSVDVLLERRERRERRERQEIAVVEIWDWFDDIGLALRSLDGKVETAGRRAPEDGHVAAGLWVVRSTRRNRALVAELHALFAAKFPAATRAWLRALGEPNAAMPTSNGFLRADVRATRLFGARLRR